MDRLTERLGIAGRIQPQALSTAATNATSPAVDLSKAGRAVLLAQIGAGTATAGVALQHSTSTAVDSFSAFSPALAATGIAGTDVQVAIEIDAIDLPAGSRYIRGIITADTITAANTKQVSALIITGDGHYQPGDDLATLTTVVSDEVLR